MPVHTIWPPGTHPRNRRNPRSRRNPRNPRKWCQEVLFRPLVPRTPVGQDGGSLSKLPQTICCFRSSVVVVVALVAAHVMSHPQLQPQQSTNSVLLYKRPLHKHLSRIQAPLLHTSAHRVLEAPSCTQAPFSYASSRLENMRPFCTHTTF